MIAEAAKVKSTVIIRTMPSSPKIVNGVDSGGGGKGLQTSGQSEQEQGCPEGDVAGIK